jgi:hypothetical protein
MECCEPENNKLILDEMSIAAPIKLYLPTMMMMKQSYTIDTSDKSLQEQVWKAEHNDKTHKINIMVYIGSLLHRNSYMYIDLLLLLLL